MLLPPKQHLELFSLVSEASGQPIPGTSLSDPNGFSLGIAQIWFPLFASPIWFYEGETIAYRVAWFRVPGDDLVVAIAINSAVSGPEDQISSLYEAVIGILEPQSVVAPGSSAPSAQEVSQ